jgi:hypothetical protein
MKRKITFILYIIAILSIIQFIIFYNDKALFIGMSLVLLLNTLVKFGWLRR